MHCKAQTLHMAVKTLFLFSAVLTGDLVNSRGMSAAQVDAAMDTLEKAASDIADDMRIEACFARHRGDGWQVFLSEGHAGLRAALRLMACLTATHKGAATRIGIGLGPATVPTDRALAAASGPAFVQAGDSLADQDRATRLSLTPDAGDAFGAVSLLLGWQAQQWTAAQAQALYHALQFQPITQEEIADRIGGITRQAVQNRLSGTGLNAIEAALRAFEASVNKSFHSTDPGAPPQTGG